MLDPVGMLPTAAFVAKDVCSLTFVALVASLNIHLSIQRIAP
jgi:hypothetical protein